jgi:hypothetical protein
MESRETTLDFRQGGVGVKDVTVKTQGRLRAKQIHGTDSRCSN